MKLDDLLELFVAIKAEAKILEATATGDEVTLDVPPIKGVIRLKNGRQGVITGVVVQVTK